MLKKLSSIFLILIMIFTFYGCNNSSMPFNGDIEFNEIALTIPEDFIRDSTQSSEDLWIFEQGGYEKYIIITRSDITGDTFESLENYIDYMKDNGADSSLTTFLDNDAVLSTYELDGLYCQEILFPHNESFYAVALRGSTADEFNTLTNTIALK